mmetsp:Transcript_9218/g.37788  ORF Transcript_9218/g.37788 Transcript_9218/m.37788 type:complete len:107 (+) Transcript_9218:536-856(+)
MLIEHPNFSCASRGNNDEVDFVENFFEAIKEEDPVSFMNKGGSREQRRADNKQHQIGEHYHDKLVVKLAEHRTQHPQKAEFDPSHPDHRTIDKTTEPHYNACELAF